MDCDGEHSSEMIESLELCTLLFHSAESSFLDYLYVLYCLLLLLYTSGFQTFQDILCDGAPLMYGLQIAVPPLNSKPKF